MPHCGPPHRCVGQCIRRGGRRFEGREASHDWIGRVIAPNDIALNLVDGVANRFANLPKQKSTGHHVDNEIALGADLVRVTAEQMFERSVQRHSLGSRGESLLGVRRVLGPERHDDLVGGLDGHDPTVERQTDEGATNLGRQVGRHPDIQMIKAGGQT